MGNRKEKNLLLSSIPQSGQLPQGNHPEISRGTVRNGFRLSLFLGAECPDLKELLRNPGAVMPGGEAGIRLCRRMHGVTFSERSG